MRALEERTGKLRWEMDTNTEGCYSSPAVVGNTVYVGSDGLKENYLFALDPATGSVRWRFVTPTQIFSTPAVAQGVVYFQARDDHLYAVGADSGALVWKVPVPYPQDEFTVFQDMSKSSPAVAGGRVFVGAGHEVLAVEAATGRELWRERTRGKVDSSPLVVGQTVYVGSDDRTLYAFAAATGARLWSFSTGGKISGAPSAYGDLLFVGSNDGYLYAFGAKR